MTITSENTLCTTPEIKPDLIVLSSNITKIDTLIQSILAGENPIIEESTDQWRDRIEGYAVVLANDIY